METSPLKKKGASPGFAIESWDDDDDFKDVADLRLSKPSFSRFSDFSSTTPSRLSVASDSLLHDFTLVDDMEKDFLLLPTTQSASSSSTIISPEDAIRSANKAGIPLPKNIPASALTGGSIRKIGPSSKRVVKVDWGDDLEIDDDSSAPSKFLTVKKVRSSEFPLDAFQTSSEDERSSSGGNNNNNHNQFHDEDDIPTIRAHKRSPRRSPLIDAFRLPTPEILSEHDLTAKLPPPTDAFEDATAAFHDLPTNLPLSNGGGGGGEKKDTVQANLSNFMDSDTDELAEGSLGTRHGGRYRSNSIMSTMSPSLASTFTLESEDESFNCIELPQPDFDFQHALEEKRKSRLLARTASDLRNAGEQHHNHHYKDDFLDDIEIGEGGLLSSKINRNKNILLKATPTSPRRSAVTLTFTRIGEQQHQLQKMKKSHARRLSISSNHSTLESVDEGGTPGGSGGGGGRPASLEISIESQKGDDQKRPQPTLKRTDPSKQSRLLRPQRSTPNLKAQNSAPMKLPQALPPPVPPIPRSFFTEHDTVPTIPTMLPGRGGYSSNSISNKGLPIARPPSRTMPNRPSSRNNSRAASRTSNRSESRGPPKSPSVEQTHSIGGRYINTSRPSSRASIGSRSKSPGRPSTPSQRPPFLPAGASQSQSQHVLSKLQRKSSAKALRPPSAQESRPPSRSSRIRERSPLRNAQASASAASGPVAPEPLRKELASTNFMLAPIKRRHYGIGNELDVFDDLPTSARLESKFTVKAVGQGAPRALRSTKRATLNTVAPPEGTLPVKETKLPRSNRRLITPPSAQRGALPLVGEIEQKRPSWRNKAPKRLNHDMPQKPHLITAATLPNQTKPVNDMIYNPSTFRWEGNEHAVRGFDKEEILPTALPRPALISSVKSAKNIQVVGKMVFDPNHMCWLKVDDTGSDDEANALADIDDLKDTNSMTERSTRDSAHGASLNDLMTAEEFDVGPEFTRRQKEEEQRWRRKVTGWISSNDARDPNRSWELRDIALSKVDGDYN